MFSDKDALRQRIDDLLPWIEYNKDKLAFIVKALKLTGTNSLVLDDKRLFVACTGKGCNLFHVKKPHSNLGFECDKCKTARNNEERCSIQKEPNKEMRVAAESRCPMQFLDDNELKDRMGQLNTN